MTGWIDAIKILIASSTTKITNKNRTCISLSLSLSVASGSSSSSSELLSWKRGSSCQLTFTGFIVSIT